jgi:hypothetical protein
VPAVPIFGHLLVVIECANLGEDTHDYDCGKQHFVKQVDGNVSYTLTVHVMVGSGKHQHDCSKEDCLVAVAQPKQKNQIERDVHITFG